MSDMTKKLEGTERADYIRARFGEGRVILVSSEPKSKRTNQRNLVRVARALGESVASSWSAYRRSGGSWGDHVAVWHYNTLMFLVHADDTVTPISRGYGSMTDKCGLRKVLADISGQGYAEVYADF